MRSNATQGGIATQRQSGMQSDMQSFTAAIAENKKLMDAPCKGTKNKQALDIARAQAHSLAARRDRKRRHHLMEHSFADAANNHHFKRARWRRLWSEQIQDYLIAAI
jgi:hypothetical protein